MFLPALDSTYFSKETVLKMMNSSIELHQGGITLRNACLAPQYGSHISLKALLYKNKHMLNFSIGSVNICGLEDGWTIKQ